jgi:flavin-binding protein dodecin
MKENPMNDTVYKKINITGTSTTNFEDAVQNAINKAGETVRNLRWFEVKEVRGAILEDLSVQWQVTVQIGLAIEKDSRGTAVPRLSIASSCSNQPLCGRQRLR